MSAKTDAPAEQKPRVTLSEIARHADVSVPTVSKVLNGHADVSALTRSKVEEALRAHQYRRRPRAQTSDLLELVFHELESEWAIEIIQGVERVAREGGLSVVVTESGDRHSPSPGWIDGVLRRRPLGVILVFSGLSEENKRKLRSRRVNFVVVDPSGEPDPDVASVGSANWAGGMSAVRHLTDLGHRRIGMITGPGDMLCSVARGDGYRAALSRAGIPFDPDLVYDGTFHVQSGKDGAAYLLSLPEPPTAIFAGSDLQALGVYETARARNIRVPDDLSVVGYDDLRLARWAGPPLTTVRQPLTEMAATAARLLVRLEEEPDLPLNQRIDLATSLVVRQSTAAPAAR
ncbi:MAG TPA: LacI family DNA-binding transcriptional regulator [Microbacteriaceae bacterium]|nr:LacI family DNA-binding transcriptional regulator [Microbacteriaceae bacterium]